jgi:hypothetical protein
MATRCSLQFFRLDRSVVVPVDNMEARGNNRYVFCLIERPVLVLVSRQKLGLSHPPTQFLHVQGSIVIDIQLVELGPSSAIDLSQIQRSVVILVPNGDNVGDTVGASLLRKLRGRDQRDSEDSNAKH